MPTLLLINGPNLSRLGSRKPEIYGTTTLADITAQLQALARARDWECVTFQSNHEGEIIDLLERSRDSVTAMVLNPGALMMNGWALRDALEDFPAPWFEVHISNIWAREGFRHESILSPLAGGVIAGLGTRCYALAAAELMEQYHAARPV